jgi:FAD/FMN-containing dehydrogenase
VLGPIRQLPNPVLDALTTKPYVTHQKMFDAAYPHGRHYYWKAHKLGPLSEEIIDVVVEHAEQVTSPLSAIPIFCFGGAVARTPEESTAFPYRDAAHDLNVVASWLPEEIGDADRHIEWVHELFSALEPYSRGVYVNFTGDDAAERVRQAYTEGQWTRLSALKAKYDPTNFFRMNANILPG